MAAAGAQRRVRGRVSGWRLGPLNSGHFAERGVDPRTASLGGLVWEAVGHCLLQLRDLAPVVRAEVCSLFRLRPFSRQRPGPPTRQAEGGGLLKYLP